MNKNSPLALIQFTARRYSSTRVFSFSFFPFRLVLSRFEFEELSSGENSLEVGEDEEEVWLFWRDSTKEIRSKSIRELAQDAKEGQKEDRDVLSYYRLAPQAVLAMAM